MHRELRSRGRPSTTGAWNADRTSTSSSASQSADGSARRSRPRMPAASRPRRAALCSRSARCRLGRRLSFAYIPTGEGWPTSRASSTSAAAVSSAGRSTTTWRRRTWPTPQGSGPQLRGAAGSGVIFHSDRGSQYLSGFYRDLCASYGIAQSAGHVATCFDNASPRRSGRA